MLEKNRFLLLCRLSASFTMKLKDMAGKLPAEVEDNLQALQIEAESLLKSNRSCGSQMSASLAMDSSEHDQSNLANEGVVDVHDPRMENHGDELELLQNSTEGNAPHRLAVTREATSSHGVETSSRSSGNSTPRYSSHGEVQLIEQFEPGVYVTVAQLQDGTKVFKQVRFRYTPALNTIHSHSKVRETDALSLPF